MPVRRDRFVRGVVGLLAMPVLGGGAAFAAAGSPPLMPTRDVAVSYSVLPDGAPGPQMVKAYFGGGGGLMRIDGPPGPPDGGSSGYMVMNRSAKTMIVVLNQPRVFMDIPVEQQVNSPFVLDGSMRFTANGAGTVAGLACTRYAIVAGKGTATACITSDGVVLSESGVDGEGNRGSLTAQSVSYAPLPASVFVPPPGFRRAAHPAGPGQADPGQTGSDLPGSGPGGVGTPAPQAGLMAPQAGSMVPQAGSMPAQGGSITAHGNP